MSQNSLVSFNYGKRNFIRDLFRCVFSLIICCIFLSPIIVQASESGGGSTRGGGAGRTQSSYGTSIATSPGYQSLHPDGTPRRVNSDIYWTGVIKMDDVTTLTAREKSIYSITTTLTNTYWLTFHNFRNGGWTPLGSTPKYKGYAVTEVPGNTTHIIVHGNSSATGFYTTQRLSAENEVAQPVNDSNITFTKANNVWQVGLYYWGGKATTKFYSSDSYSSYYCSTANMYRTEYGRIYTITNSDTIKSLKFDFIYYDQSFNTLGSETVTVEKNGTTTFTVGNINARYMHVQITRGDNNQISPTGWNGLFDITGVDDEVVSTAYQVDNSSGSTIINNHQFAATIYNITNGDGSPIIIVDGDGNTITYPGASPITQNPGDAVVLPGENTDDNGDDDGFFDSILDTIKNIFGGLGDILKGIIEILLIPVNFIVNSISDVLDLLKGTLESLGGLAEFFSQVFFFLPSPIPEMLTLFIPAILVVAIVKMFL